MSEAAALAMTEAVTEEVNQQVESSMGRIETKIDTMQSRMHDKMDVMQGRFDAGMTVQHGDIENMRRDMTSLRWFIGIVVTLAVLGYNALQNARDDGSRATSSVAAPTAPAGTLPPPGREVPKLTPKQQAEKWGAK
jgi:hypothetical protein